MSQAHYYLHLRANNDVNSNPRRCYVVFSASGNFVETIDEGYQGDYLLKQRYRELIQLTTVEVPAKEYRSFLSMNRGD